MLEIVRDGGVRSALIATAACVALLTLLVMPVAYTMAYPGLPAGEDVLSAWIPAVALGLGTLVRLGPSGLSVALVLGGGVGLSLALVLGVTPIRGFGFLLPPTTGLAMGLLDGIGRRPLAGLGRGIAAAMAISFAVGLGLIARQGVTVLMPALLLGLIIGTVVGSRTADERGSALRMPPLWLIAVVLLLTFGMWQLLRSEFERGQSSSFFGLTAAGDAAAFTGLFLYLVPVLCFLLGRQVTRWLRPRLAVLVELGQYLRAMYVPIGAFSLGYSLILLVFAGFYGSLYRWDPAHFGNPEPAPTRPDWIFFALYSAVGTTYSSLRPASPLAHVTVAGQSVLGVGWAVVVFAAVMSHLRPRLAAISERREEDSSSVGS